MTKDKVMYQVERNESNILEAVLVSLFKHVIPMKQEDINENIVTMLVKDNFGKDGKCDFEKFKENYSEKEFGAFIINLTEQINDVNIFRFEAAQEDIAEAEAQNPYLLMTDLKDGIDAEFKTLALTTNIKNKLAELISDDLDRAEQNLKKEEELKDDLDNIDPDNDFTPEPENEEEKDPNIEDDENEAEDGSEIKKYGEVEEAAWVKLNKDFKLSTKDPDEAVDDLIKNKAFVNMEKDDKGVLSKAFHTIVQQYKSQIIGIFNSKELELSEYEEDMTMCDYLAFSLSRQANPSIISSMKYKLFLYSAGMVAGILLGLNYILSIVIMSVLFPKFLKIENKLKSRVKIHQYIAMGIINDLEQKEKQSTSEDATKIRMVREEFEARMSISPAFKTWYNETIRDESRLTSALKKKKLIINESYTKNLKEITEELTESAVSKGTTPNKENIEQLTIVHTSINMVKELML